MDDPTYLTTDVFFRPVEVRQRLFTQELTTVYPDGSRETVITL